MKIDTIRFGEIQIEEEKFVKFDAGLPGMEELKRFVLISTDETAPFHWIQAVDDATISLPVVNPFDLCPEYDPVVSEDVFNELDIKDTKELLVLTISVIPKEHRNMTANFMAPIIINTVNNKGAQVIMDSSDYNMREPIFERVQVYLNGGGSNAGSDA